MAAGSDSDRRDVAHASDLDLVLRAKAGDAAATERVCERLRCVPAILRDRHARYGAPLRADELEEVQQETLTALWAKLDGYEGRASLETFAFRFTVLELLKSLARRDRRRSRFVDCEAQAIELERAPDRMPAEPLVEPERVHDCLERLGPPANDIIRMRHFEERSFEDIARTFDEPLSTVKARYYRGLERLKSLLQSPARLKT